jgi:hypothetical protein
VVDSGKYIQSFRRESPYGKLTAKARHWPARRDEKNDKKKKGGAVRFVIQREMNSTFVTNSDSDVLAVSA